MYAITATIMQISAIFYVELENIVIKDPFILRKL